MKNITDTIFDELNILLNPYNELKILENSDDQTIKEAYKLLKQGQSPEKIELLTICYNLIKTESLRVRYSLLNNRPLQKLDDIKKIGFKPKQMETTDWISIINDDPLHEL
ncbi:MAG: hypothetical protein OCD02_13470 [Spirochaetaceae bacterium]